MPVVNVCELQCVCEVSHPVTFAKLAHVEPSEYCVAACGGPATDRMLTPLNKGAAFDSVLQPTAEAKT